MGEKFSNDPEILKKIEETKVSYLFTILHLGAHLKKYPNLTHPDLASVFKGFEITAFEDSQIRVRSLAGFVERELNSTQFTNADKISIENLKSGISYLKE